MKGKKYENFTLPLALFDAVPVVLFSASMLLIAQRFKSLLFAAGAVVCVVAGLGKVSWKIILAASKKDVSFLNKQMRFLMPCGFALLIAGVVSGMNSEKWAALKSGAFSFPSVLFFAITAFSMVLMGVFAFKLDQTKARSNLIEQTTNTIAQGFFLLGVCFAVR